MSSMQQLSREEIAAAVQDHWQWLVFGQDGGGARADFSRKSLSGAHLAGVNLNQAKFTDCDLSGAVLTGAKLAGADFTRAILVGADLSNADLTNCRFRDADLDAANVSGSRAPGADFENCRMPVRQMPTAKAYAARRKQHRWLYPALGTAALLLVLAYFFGLLDRYSDYYDAFVRHLGQAS